MRRVAWLLPWIVLGGCRAGESGVGEGVIAGEARAGASAVGASAASAGAAGAANSGAGAGAAAGGDKPAVDPARARKGAALDGLMRRQDFERQDRVSLPPGLPPSITALVPAGEHVKLIELALLRRMAQTRPVAGRREVMVRWMTSRRGAALEEMVRLALVAGGWVTGEGKVESPLTHPVHGTLAWTVESPAQRAAWVRFEVVDRDPAGDLALPVAWLVEPPKWAAAVGEVVPVGFEFRHYHGRRAGTVYSDFENLVGAFRVAEPERFLAGLRAPLLAAGFRVDEGNASLLRGPGPSSFASQVLEDGVVVVHHQRRWARPEGAAEEGGGGAGVGLGGDTGAKP